MIRLFKRFFSKTHAPETTLVNNQVASVSKEGFIDFLLGRGRFKLAAHVINTYWKTCAPLSDGVDQTSSKSAAIDPSVWDNDSQAFDNDHPILGLLKQPNMLETYASFFKRLAGLYILHGEVFLISTGRINQPPLELFVAPAQTINVEVSAQDGFISTITQQTDHNQQRFYRHEEQGRFRYYDVLPSQNISEARKEIIQIASFNPDGSLIPEHGASILQSLYFEIEQWLASSKHNLSTLLRGATLSGIVSTDENLNGMTEDQKAALKQELENFIGGAENAGRIALLDNGLEFKSTTQTNKDMDFRLLKKDIKVDIYNRLGIPLPLINEDTMTMANRSVSLEQYYQATIVPFTCLLYDFITLFIMYRYKDSESNSLQVDPSNIPALEGLKIDKITKLISFGILTINETRQLIDYDALANGGDAIYGSTSDIAIASNEELPETNDSNNSSDSNVDDTTDAEKLMTRKGFIEFMRQQVDNNGKRKFTDERIKEIAEREKLQ